MSRLILDQFVIENEPVSTREGLDIHGRPSVFKRYNRGPEATKLQELRRAHGISLGTLARLLNTSTSVISGLEFGRFRLSAPDVWEYVYGVILGN